MGREDRLPWRPQRTGLTNGRNYRETDLDPHLDPRHFLVVKAV